MKWTFVPASFVDQRDRLRLRRAALRYAAHGWPVTPGAWLSGHRFACGRPGCPIMTCHPALESWEDSASTAASTVHGWWRSHPHTVLLATGGSFDALEVPAALGLRVLGRARLMGHAGPVAKTAADRWMFLVRPGVPLRSELDHRVDIVRHGRGSWIPAAPSQMLEGMVRWAVRPEQCAWHLPDATVVQALLADALGSAPTPQLVVPRQMSTSRRAA
jgi:hypothetical protein